MWNVHEATPPPPPSRGARTDGSKLQHEDCHAIKNGVRRTPRPFSLSRQLAAAVVVHTIHTSDARRRHGHSTPAERLVRVKHDQISLNPPPWYYPLLPLCRTPPSKKRTGAQQLRLPHLPEPVGGGRPGGVEGLDHRGVRHVRAPAQVHEIAVAVDRRASPIRYSGGDVLPGSTGCGTEARSPGKTPRHRGGNGVLA